MSPVHQCGPGTQHRAWHRAEAGEGLSGGRERTEACLQTAWEPQGERMAGRMLIQYFPHSLDGGACSKHENAGSPLPWPGAAHQWPPAPGTLSVKVQESLATSPAKYREVEGFRRSRK